MKISHYNQKIDIFAVGVIMAELYMNKNLFPSSDESDHIIRIFKVLGKISIKDWP
jgi:protein kinase